MVDDAAALVTHAEGIEGAGHPLQVEPEVLDAQRRTRNFADVAGAEQTLGVMARHVDHGVVVDQRIVARLDRHLGARPEAGGGALGGSRTRRKTSSRLRIERAHRADHLHLLATMLPCAPWMVPIEPRRSAARRRCGSPRSAARSHLRRDHDGVDAVGG
jgi:hypothetical protein